MKKIFTKIILSIIILNAQNANAQNWQFRKGTQALNSNPVYNTQGIANATTSPGARIGMAGFADPSAQTLYLFGGQNGSSLYNSTFVYNTGTGSWNYTTGANTANAGGVAPTGNGNEYPAARSGMGYIALPQGTSGRMIISGGLSVGSDNSTTGLTNAIWSTSTTTPNYTYHLGAYQSSSFNFIGNYSGGQGGIFPGCTNYPCLFTEAALTQKWEFGGIDADGFTNNAMLRAANLNANTFTRVAGSPNREDPGSYNGQGNAGTPAARAYAAYWRDASGNFWIFGGSNPTQGKFNDLWRFNPTTSVFTLIKGTAASNTASYGTINTSTASNFPPARELAAAVVGSDGKFYIFGGANGTSYYNDLWQYDPTTNKWTWLKGSNTPNAFATEYNGANSPTATPGATKGAMAWRVNTTMWIYGGEGYVASGSVGRLADLWSIPLNNFTVTVLPVSLTNFNASLKDNTTNLTWETATESNTNYFEIQYSNDGANFKYASKIAAYGNSSSLKKYTTTHNINNENYHYYRLKIVDNDGKFYYSDIVKLKSTNAYKPLEIEAYPTIVTSHATLSIYAKSKGTASILIQNMMGQPIQHNTIKIDANSHTLPIDMGNYAKGTFIITVQIGEEKKSIQIVKQ